MTASICWEAKNYRDVNNNSNRAYLILAEARLAPLWGILFILLSLQFTTLVSYGKLTMNFICNFFIMSEKLLPRAIHAI
jgi:hypothetical protein